MHLSHTAGWLTYHLTIKKLACIQWSIDLPYSVILHVVISLLILMFLKNVFLPRAY